MFIPEHFKKSAPNRCNYTWHYSQRGRLQPAKDGAGFKPKRLFSRILCCLLISCLILPAPAFLAEPAQAWMVEVGDSANYEQVANWTASTWIKANDTGDGVMSRMLQAAPGAGSAAFHLPSGAPGGHYDVYYYLTHKTTSQTILVNGTDVGFSIDNYDLSGWSSDSQGAWVLLGHYTLKGDGSDQVQIVTNGSYARATSIRFIQAEPTTDPKFYLDETFESTGVTGWTASASGTLTTESVPSASNRSLKLTHTGPTQVNLAAPALANLPTSDTVVLDLAISFESMHTKTVFLVRDGPSNGLFMHAEFMKKGEQIYFQYYNGSTTPTPSPNHTVFKEDTWYRLIALFHCDTAVYDVYLYDIQNNYILEQISGIHPKAATVTPGNAQITKFEMQNHNTSAPDTLSTVWYMDHVQLFDGTDYTLPDAQEPPVTPIEPVTSQRIGVHDAGFSLGGEGWVSASMPDSTGAAGSYYGNTEGAYAQYQPANLKPGWYQVSFWNIKYQDHQNPMKMTATIHSNGETRTDLPLPANTTSADREGRWDPVGIYYFTGSGEEYLRLVSDGRSFARPSDAKFELLEDYEPIPVLGLNTIEVINPPPSWQAEGRNGAYEVYLRAAAETGRTLVQLAENGLVMDQQEILLPGTAGWIYLGTYSFHDFKRITISSERAGIDGVRFSPASSNGLLATNYTLSDLLQGGRPLYFLTAGEFSFQTEVTNQGSPRKVRLVGAAYEGTRLLDVDYGQPVAFAQGETKQLSGSLQLLHVTQDTRLAVYLWDGDTLQPLARERVYRPRETQQDAPYLITAQSFLDHSGTWNVATASDAFDGRILAGMTSKISDPVPAEIPVYARQDCTLRLWVHSKNFATLPDARYFRVAFNGAPLSKTFGQVGQDGYFWEDGGTVELRQGENILSVLDSSQYYAKLDAIYLCAPSDPAPPSDYTTLTELTQPLIYEDMSLTQEDLMKDVTIQTDFPGGNLLVNGMKKNIIDIAPDLSDTSTDWFYWNFTAQSESDRTITFRLKGNYIISGAGAAYSYDDENWSYLSASSNGSSFTFPMEAGKKVHFACAIPYQEKDLQAYLATIQGKPMVETSVLCQSEEGRDVPLVTIGNPDAPKKVVFTSRHHCCEMTPSYLLEGLMDELIAMGDCEFLNQYCFTIIPMVDIDGVENGDQGKQRIPHDHNRDYDQDLYAVIRAIKDYFADTQIDVFMDFHCPGLQDPKPYLYLYNDGREEIEHFSAILKETTAADQTPGAIVYDGSRDFEDGNHYMANSSGYFYLAKGAKLSTTLEFPYTGTVQNSYTKNSIRRFGHQVAKAFKQYLLQYIQ